MSDITYLVLARAIERLLIVCIAGLSLYFGWALFKRNLDAQRAEFAAGSYTIKFTRVAPGIFFAFFSVALLVFALRQPLQLSPIAPSDSAAPNPETQNTNAQLSAIYMGGNENNIIVKAFNTLDSTIESNSSLNQNLKPFEVKANNTAFAVLNEIKNNALQQRFGDEVFATYIKYKDRSLHGQNTDEHLTSVELSKIRGIEAEATETFLDESRE